MSEKTIFRTKAHPKWARWKWSSAFGYLYCAFPPLWDSHNNEWEVDGDVPHSYVKRASYSGPNRRRNSLREIIERKP